MCGDTTVINDRDQEISMQKLLIGKVSTNDENRKGNTKQSPTNKLENLFNNIIF